MQILDVRSINAALCIDGPDFIEVHVDDPTDFLQTPAPPWNKGKTGWQQHSEETKRKISEAVKGRPDGWQQHSEETKRKISEAVKGRPAPNKGIPHKEETKTKISEANKGNTSYWKGKKIPKESVEKMKQNLPDRKGSNNARAREYEITYEDGRTIVITSLQTWARENGYVPMSLRNLYNGSGRTKYKDIINLRPL
jgi:hypothetical protein